MSNNLQHDQNFQQRERLEALYHLAVELSAVRDLQSVLNTALRHCLELTDSQFGFIGLNTSDGANMDVAVIQGFHPASEFYAHFHLIPLRPSIFANVVLENSPIRSRDTMTDPARVGQPRGHPPVHAFLGVPLRVREKPIGMIGVANRPLPYDDEHEQLLVTYAAQVAIAIRNAQLYEELKAAKEELERKVVGRTQELGEAKEALAQKAEQLQRLLADTVDVQERERQRIAQDMHDGVTQLLIGSMLELKSARERISSGDLDRADSSLQQVREVLGQVEREIRQIIYDLRPPILDEFGIGPSLRRYADYFQQYFHIPCEVRVEDNSCRLSADVEIGIYRIMQEALQNVSAHAAARHVEVNLSFLSDKVMLSITDDGWGFDPQSVPCDEAGHFGLLGMRERAQALGGQLTIESEIGRGTQVRLFLPVTASSLSVPQNVLSGAAPSTLLE